MTITPYEKNIHQLRADEDKKSAVDLLDWLNLVGLFWLEEGENSFGSDENNKISLPGFPAAFCGAFHFKNNQVSFQPAKDIKFTSNKPNPKSHALITDANKEPDLITIGSLTMKIIIRRPATLVRI